MFTCKGFRFLVNYSDNGARGFFLSRFRQQTQRATSHTLAGTEKNLDESNTE